MPGRVVVQWDKDDCADMGIVKVDLLGLGMMAVLEDTIELVPEVYGEEVDLAHLPPDDPAVYDSLQGRTRSGCSRWRAGRRWRRCRAMRPDHFYDIVVQVAIIRPGPIVGKMVHPYLSGGRAGKRRIVCIPRWSPSCGGRWGCRCFRSSC